MRVNPAKLQFATFVLAVVGVGISTIFIVAAWGFLRQAVLTVQPGPAVAVRLLDRPASEPHCPGQYITYGVVLDPIRHPIAVRLAVTMWSEDEQRTAVVEHLGKERVVLYTEDETVETVDRFFIPRKDRNGRPVKPGTYELRMGAVVEGAAPAIVALPFTILPSCPIYKGDPDA